MDENKVYEKDEALEALNIDFAFRPIDCTPQAIQEQLDCGYMVAGASGADFLYIYEDGGAFELCLHEFGSDDLGRQRLPKGDAAKAMFANFCSVAEVFIAVRYKKELPIVKVMQGAEEALITANPEKYRPLMEAYLKAHPEAAAAQ